MKLTIPLIPLFRLAPMLSLRALVGAAALFISACAPQPFIVSQPQAPEVSQSRPREMPRARIILSPSSLDFGDVAPRRSADADVTVRNEGNEEARLSRVVVEGEGFRLARDGCSNRWLRPGEGCSVGVSFYPEGEGTYSGVLELFSPDLAEKGVRLPLSGDSHGRRAPNLRVSASSLDFGSTEAGRPNVQNLELRNDGRGDLRIEQVAAEGLGFEVASDGCSGRLLPPGRSCAVGVRFSPGRSGGYSGGLSIQSNDPDQRRVVVSLLGQAERGRAPDIAVVPTRLDFGRVEAGRARELDVEVRNEGRGDLGVRRAFVEGLGFEVSADGCTGQVTPRGRSCRLTVRFSPASGGDFAGSLAVVSNDPDERRAVVPLGGQGQPPSQPNLRLRVPKVDFGAVETGSARTQDVEVRNDGRADLRIQDVSLEGPGFDLAADSCSRSIVPPGRSCAVNVRFSPNRGGEHFGNLVLDSNDPDQRRATVPLRGQGEMRGRPEITINPSRIDFGRVEAGKPRAQDVEVRNDGRADLKVKRVRVEGKGFEVQLDGCSDRAVPPGRSCGVSVRFVPDAGGEYNGTLGVPSNDPDEKKSFVALRGVGEKPGKTPERSCRAQRVELRADGDRLRAFVEGDLGDDPCVTLEFRAEEKSSLLVCVPEGYQPRGTGLEPSRDGGCDLGKGRYQAFRSPRFKKAEDASVTLVRGPGAPGKFQVLLELETKGSKRRAPPTRGSRGDN